jgi:hypothetical protein
MKLAAGTKMKCNTITVVNRITGNSRSLWGCSRSANIAKLFEQGLEMEFHDPKTGKIVKETFRS